MEGAYPKQLIPEMNNPQKIERIKKGGIILNQEEKEGIIFITSSRIKKEM